MKCMCAQTRPRFILSSEGVFGGMEFEPMLTPRGKIPSTENVPRGGSNPRRCGQRAQALPTELFRPQTAYNQGVLLYTLWYMNWRSWCLIYMNRGMCLSVSQVDLEWKKLWYGTLHPEPTSFTMSWNSTVLRHFQNLNQGWQLQSIKWLQFCQIFLK